jgi:penicillin-binding protein 1B
MEVLRLGESGSPEKLIAKLERLLYQPTEKAPDRAGHFRRQGNTVEVFTRNFQYPGKDFKGFPASVEFGAGKVVSVRDASGGALPALVIEPERLGSVFGDEFQDRTLVRLEDLPQSLKDAVLVTEDRDFYRHAGVSIRRLFGAAMSNVRKGGLQGGSTLTQQVVKNLFLRPRDSAGRLGAPERTLRRKALEAVLAVILDARYSKDEIFAAYFNEIYLGQHGSVAVNGVGEAARHYFGKDASDLDLAESATIAGMIKAPNIYSPAHNPAKAKQGRDLVLRQMREEKKIDDAAMARALAQPVIASSRVEERTIAPHFVDFVKRELQARFSRELKTEGLQIYTTLDVDLQRSAQRAITQGLAGLEKNYKRLAARAKEEPLQGALIALEPRTGSVRAFVGGRDYRVSQFNRVTQAHRQPGSLFKPFVYLAAFARRDMEKPITPATILEDTPITVTWGKGTEEEQWSPHDYDGDFRGSMSARKALELSINIPTVRTALAAGLPTVLATARAAGVGSELRPYPSVALGAFEVSPLEIASAYSVFANGGVRVEPIAIVGVVTSDGRVLERKETPLAPVLPADAVFLVDSLMRGAVDRGTASAARSGGIKGVLAGKTGTTNDYRDCWFIGFSPRFLAAVWVGYDDNRPVRLTGTQAAVPIFADFSRSLPAQYFTETFPVPSDIVTAEIDPDTGYLASPECPRRMTEVFIAQTQPTVSCPIHHLAAPLPVEGGLD